MKIERIFDILENAKNEFPDKETFLSCKLNKQWIPFSTSDYYSNAHFLSLGLLALGLKKGDRVATVSNNRPEWNFMDMAIMQAGLVHVPIYPTISAEEYAYILDHCSPRLLIISDENLYNRISPLVGQVKSITGVYTFNKVEGAKNWEEIKKLGVDSEDKFKADLASIKAQISTDELATLIYTSGTTGNPKGVMLSHKNILSNINGIKQIFDFGPTESALSFLPISHVFERTINYYFQRVGVSIYYAENLGTISENLKEVKPSVFIAVPRVLERIYDKIVGVGKELKGIKKILFFWAVNLGLRYEFYRKNGWFYHFKLGIADKLIFSKWRLAVGNKCKVIVSGGAALQPRLVRIFNAAGIPLAEGYGMTETSPVISANSFVKNELMIGTVGPPLSGVSVKIADDGEILIKGDNVMMGYYNDKAATDEMFNEDGWLKTGDVGVLIDDRFLKITDRKKEIFKLSSGKYVAPQPIENKFKESLFVEQAMVVGENEKFASAIISPNFQYLHSWSSKHRISFRDNRELIKSAPIIELYQGVVGEMNKRLGQTEQIKRFRLVEEEWSQQSGELSPTLKLKRRFLYEKYTDLLAEIYSVQKGD